MKDELASTSVIEAVERDLKNITKEFNNVVLPFIKKHKDVFRSVPHEYSTMWSYLSLRNTKMY